MGTDSRRRAIEKLADILTPLKSHIGAIDDMVKLLFSTKNKKIERNITLHITTGNKKIQKGNIEICTGDKNMPPYVFKAGTPLGTVCSISLALIKIFIEEISEIVKIDDWENNVDYTGDAAKGFPWQLVTDKDKRPDGSKIDDVFGAGTTTKRIKKIENWVGSNILNVEMNRTTVVQWKDRQNP